jgi:hypothetical protein
MRVAISLVIAGCLLAAGCRKEGTSDSVASNAPSCAAVDDLLLKIEDINENIGMQDAFQAGLQSLPDSVRSDAVNRINAKVASDGARMRAAEGGPRQWVALLLLSVKSEARAVEDFRYCNGDFDFGNGQRWHWTYSMSNGPAGPELRIQTAQMATGGVAAGLASSSQAKDTSIVVTGVDTGNAIGADSRISVPRTTFATMDDVFVAVSTTTGDPAASVPGKLGVKWTHTDSNQVIHEETKDVVFSGSGVTNFRISKSDGWPAGSYRVEISLNGALAQARNFQVLDGSNEYADAATAAADAAASAADGYDDGAYDAQAALRERERARIAEERQQLERDRRELVRQREQVAAQRANAEAEAARNAQEQAWREQEEAARRRPTADELYEGRRRECPGGFLGTDCRKKIREQVCAGHWSSTPEPGYSNCRN